MDRRFVFNVFSYETKLICFNPPLDINKLIHIFRHHSPFTNNIPMAFHSWLYVLFLSLSLCSTTTIELLLLVLI